MSGPGSWWRSTIRVRLTLLYGGAFFLAGALLVALMYVFMAQALDRQVGARMIIADEQLGETPTIEGGGSARIITSEARRAIEAQFRQDRDNTLNSMLIASLVALGVVGLAAGGLGWLMAGQTLQPLRQITGTARRVADRSLHERIGLVGPADEIKDLADTFDAMLERLDRSFDSQRRFVANASHELRTPLAINRTLLEVALDDPAADESVRQLGTTLLAVNQRHERLIDGLLTLAGSEQRISDRRPLDLADICRHVSREWAGAIIQAGLELRSELEPAPVLADAVLLERLIQNLLDNAIGYNLAEGGWLSLATYTAAGQAYLVVENSGPIIAAYDVPILFEPFRRLPSTDRLVAADGPQARGAGLGLSIVRSVAQAHGGDATAVARTEGGLSVTVRLPLAPTP